MIYLWIYLVQECLRIQTVEVKRSFEDVEVDSCLASWKWRIYHK